MARVELKNVTKKFRPRAGEEVVALNDLSLVIEAGELVVLVGPSGGGKTTALRVIAGLEDVFAGEVLIGGASMRGVPPQDRDIALVFQRDALYPHMTVFENMAFGLELREVPRQEIESRVSATAEKLGIAPLLHRPPGALSGGERQRAALGRALVRRPKILLLDEPLSHLDAPLRVQLRKEISQLQKELGVTMLYVTHDPWEATALGRRLIVMNQGTVVQTGVVADLRARPATEFVAQFFAPAD